MGKFEAKMALYAQELRAVCLIVPDFDLLERVTLALGPQVLADATAVISGDDNTALPKLVASFMSKYDAPSALQPAMLRAVLDCYPKPQRYRAVVAYLIAQNFALKPRILPM